jgi:hypothetical protein
MGVLVIRKKVRRKLTSLLLLLSFVTSGFFVPLSDVLAAQVGIDTTVSTAQLEHVALGSSVVFTTDQVGYKFYVDSGGTCVYSKTTNGGTSWGAAVTVNSDTTCFGVSVWYDRWTPGDSGNLIHIVSSETTGTDEIWYNNLDVTTDTRLSATTGINASSNTGQGVGAVNAAGANAASITKATNGTIYMAINDNTDSYVVECTSGCNATTGWTETGTNPMDLIDEWSLLMPLSGGDILLINRDLSADDLRSKVWDDSAGSWSGTWTTIDASAIENATYDPAFSAAINIRTGDVYLAYVDNSTGGTHGGSNDDIRTAVYSGGTWTAKTDVVTNVAAAPAAIVDVSISIDAYDGDVYVAYVGRTTAATATTGRVYWKSSTNAMTTWSGQTGPVDTVGADDKYGLSFNMTSEERLYITWYGITPDDMWGDTVANMAPGIITAGQGTQATQLRASTTNQYIGASFEFTNSTTSRNITSIELNEAGTVDASVDLDNIKLFYENDTTAPYDCASESYNGTETQYGSTDTDSFSAANGYSTFTGSVAITSTSTMCVYPVMDVKQTASTKTIELQIEAPMSDIAISGNLLMTPMAAVALTGTTNVVDSNLTQTHYHWRYDNGNETAATSRTGGTEDVSSNIQQETPVRLRIGVSNSTGASSTTPTKFRLEYAPNPSTCSAATGWTDVNGATDDWDMYDSTFITNGADTTNIAVTSGGVTNVGTTFLTPNGGQLDTTSQTGSTTLTNTQYTELEYTIIPATDIPENSQYCFRVTDAGDPLPVYTNYAQATVKLSNDFRIQRGVSTITAGATTVTITAGTNYMAPNSTTTAFIRITNTGLTGAGQSTGAGTSNASNVMARISNPDNLRTSITFTRTGTTNDTRIAWEIIEYQGVAGGDNEMRVRRTESITYTNGSATLNGTVLSNVTDDADVVVFITGQGNPNANTTAYVSGLSTAAWDGTNNRPVLTRNATTGAVPVSVAVVEFTGANWKIQRSEHTYAAAGTTETNSITAVNSLSRTFLHVQKRASVNTHANFSHEVWLSGIGQISFLLDAAATTPAGQVTVAWVIENTQTTGGTPMDVTRSSSLLDNIGTSPETNSVSIGKTLSDISIASIFVNNRSDTAVATWPEPIIAARITSNTNYELWRSDITANLNYRTEIVEWPTAVRKFEQENYWLYVDNDDVTPTDIWPAGVTDLGENTEMTATDVPTTVGDTVRIRMSVAVSGASMAAGAESFKLQFGRRTTPSCGGVTTWYPVGEIGSTTAAWRGIDNTPADGTLLSPTDPPGGGDLLLTGATVTGSYEEENNSTTNPFVAFPGDAVEYDWVVQHNSTAAEKSSYCFRMVEDDNTVFTTYTNYPVIRTVGYEPLITDWRWYEDETNATPSTPRAGENVSPSNMEIQNIFKLRVVLRESSGANGNNVKFALQYSEYADFSQGVHTLVPDAQCQANSIWCYADGAGVDNAVINSSVISSADSCVAGVGNGCGTHNESTSTAAVTFDQIAYADAEHEFTLRHAGARTNAVYYFRLYNMTYDEVVTTAPTYSYPSLVTEGAAMTASVSGVTSGTSIAGIVTDIATTPSAISFGSLNLSTDYEAAQQIAINTNATEGYQLLAYGAQNMQNVYGDPIPPVTGTNAVPGGWGTVCNISSQTGCFGYHTTDATLNGGSSRFSPTDSYAALDTTPREVMYSSMPTSDTENMIYRVKVSALQPAGSYTADIVYIAVPVH